jgi:pimeloyl-ACP methyl ester carboxylesterase
VLEDPVSHFADRETPAAMLAWDEANLPHDIEGLMRLNPKWSRLDAAWKVVSLEQIRFSDAKAAFSGNAPWDLRDDAAKLAARQPTVWVMPSESRFVPVEDQERLRGDVGEDRLAILDGVGHSVHRDAVEAFVDIVERVSAEAGR